MAKLTKAKINKYRRRLIEFLQELGIKLDHMEDAVLQSDGETSPDEADEFGSENYQQEFQLALIENEEEIMREVKDALHRLEAGTYGVCEGCEELIPERRLEVLPYARHCVECQRKVEENGSLDEN